MFNWEDWRDIHEDFSKKGHFWNKTYQQEWKEQGLTSQDAQQWISIGFKPSDYYLIGNWKNRNFTSQETKLWIEENLTPYDSDFAYCLKKDNYQPTDLSTNNLEQLRKKVFWQDIHEEFSIWQRINWENKGFDYQKTKE